MKDRKCLTRTEKSSIEELGNRQIGKTENWKVEELRVVRTTRPGIANRCVSGGGVIQPGDNNVNDPKMKVMSPTLHSAIPQLLNTLRISRYLFVTQFFAY